MMERSFSKSVLCSSESLMRFLQPVSQICCEDMDQIELIDPLTSILSSNLPSSRFQDMLLDVIGCLENEEEEPNLLMVCDFEDLYSFVGS